VYLEVLKGNHRTIQKVHLTIEGLRVSGTVRHEPVSAYRTTGTDLLIVLKVTWLMTVYNGIAGIRDYSDPVPDYLGFPPFLMVFVGALLVFDGLE
jgi:hypothetical protein